MDLSEFTPPKVCFFDSGIGGLNLLHEASLKLPHANLFYFADNFRVPYGSLSDEELIDAVDGIFSEIANVNPDAAVIACNTVTARCAAHLRSKYFFPIIGIQPAVKEAVRYGTNCVVFATPSTAESDSLKALIRSCGNGSTEVVACPEFAQLIEQNIFDLNEEKLLDLLPDVKPDAVILGCTHYIFVKKAIERKYGCPAFTGVEGTVKRLLQILGEDFSENSPLQIPEITFIGGDSEKNRRVFYDVLCALDRSGEIFPTNSQKIPKKG